MTNQVYTYMNQDFLNKFNTIQKKYLEKYYYKKYLEFYEKSTDFDYLTFNLFIKKVTENDIFIIQQHCLSCKSMNVFFTKEKPNYKYCTYCGRESILEYSLENIDRIRRIINVHNIAFKKLRSNEKEFDMKNDKLLTFETIQLEIVALNSLLETLVKEYYLNFLALELVYLNSESIIELLESNIKNDFQNIDKIVQRFKQDINIDIKSKLMSEDIDNLRNLVELRNIFTHNNGYADKKFLSKKVSEKLKEESNIIGDKFVLVNREHFQSFFQSVVNLFEILIFFQEKRFGEMIKKIIFASTI